MKRSSEKQLTYIIYLTSDKIIHDNKGTIGVGPVYIGIYKFNKFHIFKLLYSLSANNVIFDIKKLVCISQAKLLQLTFVNGTPGILSEGFSPYTKGGRDCSPLPQKFFLYNFQMA